MMRSWLRRLRGVLCLTQLLVAGGCSPFALPVATPSTSGFQKIPLRLAVVLTKEDEDWGGREYYKHETPGLYRFALPAISVLATPLKCDEPMVAEARRDLAECSKGNDLDVEACMSRRGWAGTPGVRFDGHMTINVWMLREQAQETLRRNLPLLFDHVEFLSEGPRDSKAYDLVLRPTIARWPGRTASITTVGMAYEFAFSKPSGEVLLEEVAPGTVAPLYSFDTRRPFPCDYRWPRGQRPVSQYTTALANAQADAITSFFSRGDVAQTFKGYAEELKLEAQRRELPAKLAVDVRFDDTRSLLPNGRLDAGEEAELTVTVINEGRGAGYGVILAVSADRLQVLVPDVKELGEIAPGERREVRVPVKSVLDLSDGAASLLIETKERRGYDARTVKLVLPTARLERPVLSITAHEVNGFLTNGETIELLVSVRNAGPGPAAGAALALTSVNPAVTVVQGQAALGRILPGQTVRGRIALAIPRTYPGGRLDVILRVEDGRGASVGAATREVPLAVEMRQPVLAATTRVLGVGGEVRGLTNGDTVELEVTPRNTGALDAEAVLVRVRADQPGVSLEGDQAEIGSLKAGAAGLPQRFGLTLPRVFDGKRLLLRVELAQRDFAGLVETLELPVAVRRPVLASDFRVIGRHGGRVLEQNETAELEVWVLNTGDLAAREVQARIEVTVPGVQVQESKSVALGTIPDKDQAVARFRLRLLRSASPGDLPIALTVTQADFPALIETLRAEVRPEQPVEQRVAEPAVGPAPPPRVRPPVIVVVPPGEGQPVYKETVELRATVVDEKGLGTIHVAVNGIPVPVEELRQGQRRRPRGPDQSQDQADLVLPLRLVPGKNTVTVRAYNRDNEHAEASVTVIREDPPSDLAELSKHLIVMIEGNFGSPDTLTWGAGIVLGAHSDRLYVATANHVVRRGTVEALDLKIHLRALPGQAIPVTLAGHYDDGREVDLGVLVLEGVRDRRIPLDALPFGRLGRSDALARGAELRTVGYPGGKHWWYPVTPHKLASVDEKLLKFQPSYLTRGDSGGGLFNERWELVGMVIRDAPPEGEAVRIERVIERLQAWGYPVALKSAPR